MRPALRERFGLYSEMFAELLKPAAPEIEFRIYNLLDGDFPKSPGERDAWLVGGSPSGAYDPEPWIPPLEDFLRAAFATGRPILGVCFGHQILAQALGGKVEKSGRGWGVGVHDYQLQRRMSWMAGDGASLRLRAMHQDQVIQSPPGATLLCRSEFCPIAGLVYGDPERPQALSFQAHPEFSADFARALIELRRVDAIPEAVAEPALASLEAPVMNSRVAEWMVAMLGADSR